MRSVEQLVYSWLLNRYQDFQNDQRLCLMFCVAKQISYAELLRLLEKNYGNSVSQKPQT